MSRYLSFRDGGKTNEEGISRYVGKFLDGDTFTGLETTQQGPLALGVTVTAGDIMIDSGNGYPYIGWSDASINLTLTTADGTNPRYDVIVAYVDLSVVSSASSNNPNALVVAKVTGTPAGSPSVPNAAAIQAVIGASNPYVVIARVLVGAGVTTITNSNITDMRTLVSLAVNSAEVAAGGWSVLQGTFSVATTYNAGQKEFLISTSIDQSLVIQAGDKFKVSRGTTPPTQCTDLEAGSTQYAVDTTLTGITFTDDFTIEGWIKLESYGTMEILSRESAAGNGWALRIDSVGRVLIFGAAGAAYDIATSYQSVPLGIWTHVAATLDMSGTTGTIYLNGASVPLAYTNGGASSLTQGTDVTIGRNAGTATGYFDGKISDIRLWNVVRTATQIRDNMNQQLVGSETNLIGYWKLNGNFNDSTANANNMTGQNSAVATNADNPMNSTEYAIVTKVTSTTITVFGGLDNNIPNMTLSSPYHSRVRNPFGFNGDVNRWKVLALYRTSSGNASNTIVAQYLGHQLYVPTGAWTLGGKITALAVASGAGASAIFSISQSTSAIDDSTMSVTALTVTGSQAHSNSCMVEKGLVLTAQALSYVVNIGAGGGITMNMGANASDSVVIYATCGYV